MPSEYVYTKIGRQKIKLSNLEKILYPSLAISKAEIIQYYISVAPYILPLIKGRALTLIRFPDGIKQHSFYAKNKPDWTPDWIPQISTPWDDENVFLMVQEPEHLAWLANLAALEIHNINSRSGQLLHPDHFIIDLDPSEGQSFEDVKNMAFELKGFLESYHYNPLVKTSGGKGLHLWIPIKPEYSYDQMILSSRKLMELFEKTHDKATLKLSKEKRAGKILLDIYRNHPANTTASPFSLRAKTGAPVSMPISWEKLNDLTSAKDFTIKNAIKHLEVHGNPWKDIHLLSSPLNDQKKTIKTTSKVSGKPYKKSIQSENFNHMLCDTAKELPPDRLNYSYEIKWDGLRVFFLVKNGEYTIKSRSGRDLTDRFPDFKEGQVLNIDQGVFDGELVCLDERGVSNFSDIISRMHSSGKDKINFLSHNKKAFLYLFDCLVYDETDIRHLEFLQRHHYLNEAISNHPRVRISQIFQEADLLLSHAEKLGLEGIIIKNNQSQYLEGQRSDAWLKLKFRKTIDCFIVGFTVGKGDRAALFGSLHLVSNENNMMIYRGRVGSGFNHDLMQSILKKLQALKTSAKPFDESVEDENNSIWVEAKLKCEVQYASLTNNGTLREPVFKKLIDN